MKHLHDVPDFPSLVRWICDRDHNGKVLPFGKRAGISPALADRWAYGTVKSPNVFTVRKF